MHQHESFLWPYLSCPFKDKCHVMVKLDLLFWHLLLSFADYLVTKCGVLMMSLFVFFTTTMSVSFTLRETQTRMLKFTGLFWQMSYCLNDRPHLWVMCSSVFFFFSFLLKVSKLPLIAICVSLFQCSSSIMLDIGFQRFN